MYCGGQGAEVVTAVWVADGLTPKTCAVAPPHKTAPSKKSPHTNPPVKHTVPSTPSGKKAPFKKAPVRTKPAAFTVKGKTRTVEDDEDPDTMVSVLIMLATIEVETKHLVYMWATINKDAKAYIQNRGTTKSGAAAIPEHKCLGNMEFFFGVRGVAVVYSAPTATDFLTDAMGDAVDVNGPVEHHHLDFIQSDSFTLPLQKIKVSRAHAVSQNEPVFGADKESEVKQEDREKQTAEDNDEGGIFENEMEGDESIAAAKRKAKKDKPMPMEDAYTCGPCLKKLKPTDPDTGAVNNELVVPGQHVSNGKTLIKKSDRRQGIIQGPGQDHANEDAARPQASQATPAKRASNG
ncbi:hypothetical protein BDK51DRAFT_34303 [Blyttiomyces helicus]|uniref:Uncharacterized protein n=1 Tax=Blyttiomyces helicus TaxID=388810 RepID=A0A4P9W182_9FUNG|nr:hypothetical protein BDK51DRAFT_34303 [Blyttiomyces helicus]|eukprot:RKO85864.1 hypothetical protein BDK51DRAFT_34303 [Blyttiomyces helicus]